MHIQPLWASVSLSIMRGILSIIGNGLGINRPSRRRPQSAGTRVCVGEGLKAVPFTAKSDSASLAGAGSPRWTRPDECAGRCRRDRHSTGRSAAVLVRFSERFSLPILCDSNVSGGPDVFARFDSPCLVSHVPARRVGTAWPSEPGRCSGLSQRTGVTSRPSPSESGETGGAGHLVAGIRARQPRGRPHLLGLAS